MSDFGFTNDDKEYQRVVDYYEAMKADGWESKPTYGDHEPELRHATLCKDGFKAHAKMRKRVGRGKWKYEVEINVWGPDGLAVNPGMEYSMMTLMDAIRRCNLCGATDVDTQRFSFAGRCCAKCLPEAQRKHEFPGWTN